MVAGLVVLGVSLTVTVAGAFVTLGLMPASSGTIRALVVLGVLTLLAAVVRPRFGSWAQLGVKPWSRWSRRPLLLLPLVLALSPLAFGVRSVEPAAWIVLGVGYTMTGFAEELVWRGMVLRVLAPLGAVRGPLVGSVLFGLAHLSNVLFRDSVALVAAQAWGAFCFGVGYAALRRRTGTIVPLMGLHLLTDACAAVSAGPTIALLVGQDVVLLTFGVLLLARESWASRHPGRPAAGASGREAATSPDRSAPPAPNLQ